MNETHEYHRIPPEHIKEAYAHHEAAHLEWNQKRNAFISAHGAIGVVIQGYGVESNHTITGLIIPDLQNPPKHLRRAQQNPDWYHPDKRSKQGRTLQEALDTLNKEKPSPTELLSIAGLKSEYWSHGRIYSAGFFQDTEGGMCITINARAGYVPPEYAIKLKASQYHAYWEAAEEARKTPAPC